MPIIKGTGAMAREAVAAVDWAAIDAITDDDIARQVAENPDAAPLMTEDEIAEKFRTGAARWVDPALDVHTVRDRLGLSEADFAAAIGVGIETVFDWEAGRAVPRGPARVLLTIIDREPEAVKRALGG